VSVRLIRDYLGGFVANKDFSDISGDLSIVEGALETGTCEGADFIGWQTLPRDYDRVEFARIKAAAEKIRSDSDVLIVIGIGGSYLGARAVIELLGSRYYNELSDLKIYFAVNNISAQSLENTLRLCEGKRVSLNVVSKSGTTLEPALAFRVFKDYLEERCGKEEAAKRIYATTDKARGSLKRLADIEGYECFAVPDDVGGRYSVLTAVGLLPIAAAGLDIDALMDGAREAMDEYFAGGDKMSEAAAYAATRYLMYKKGKTVELLSSYEPDFAVMC